MFLIYAIKFKPHQKVKKKETDSLPQKIIRKDRAAIISPSDSAADKPPAPTEE